MSQTILTSTFLARSPAGLHCSWYWIVEVLPYLWRIKTFFRNSCPEVFCKKGVLKNFAKLTGKHQCQSLFLNKVAGLRPATILKRRLWHTFFRVNFAKFPRTSFFTEHLWWLLLISEMFISSKIIFPGF